MTTFRVSLPFDLPELDRLARLATLANECQGDLPESELAAREGEIRDEVQGISNLLLSKIRMSQDRNPRSELAEFPSRISQAAGATPTEKARALLNLCRELGAAIPG